MVNQIRSLVSRVRTARREHHYNRLAKAGLNPFVHMTVGGTALTQREARRRMGKGHLLVPNVSGFYHGILRAYWERYGLGKKCLLVSETIAVGKVFAQQYPATTFATTDYYLDLQPTPQCDVVWDLCSAVIPDQLRGFSSVVNQATMEHIRDPVQVMQNLIKLMEPGGILYLQTHTPAFYYHGYPRDYIRYFPDWFIDIPETVREIKLLELLCVDGHAFAVYQKGADASANSVADVR